MNDLREHLYGVYRILKYLKLASEKGHFFRKNVEREVRIYTNEEWILRSLLVIVCIHLKGNLISWRGKKQPIMSYA